MDLSTWTSESLPRRAERTAEPSKSSPSLPWTEKYRPNKLDDIVGNPPSVQAVKDWGNSWSKGKPKKRALLLYGPPGTGKTTVAYALASEMGWEVLEMNASDKRSQEVVEQIAGLASQTQSISGGKRMILVEEIEGLSGVADRGATKALVKIIRETRVPIILTCNDINSKKLSGLKVYCEQVELKRIPPKLMIKALYSILEREGVLVESVQVLEKIAENSEGDLRSAINDLQALAQGLEHLRENALILEKRDRKLAIFTALHQVFHPRDYASCRRVLWNVDEEPRRLILWIDENLPFEYHGADMAVAYNRLSRADVFLGRVTNRQYWGFLRYVNDLMTVGVGFSGQHPPAASVKYHFPSVIWKQGRSRARRAMESQIASKISPSLHASKKRLIQEYLPLVQRLAQKNQDAALRLLQDFDLTEEEKAFLLQS